MRLVIQRVSEARVEIDGQSVGTIGKGLLVLCGFEAADGEQDLDWMASKLVNMRIFTDEAGLMNLSVMDVNGDILIVSQFTLHASTKKGNRPGFVRAARPKQAIPLYENFKKKLSSLLQKPVESGQFGADMQVHLCNDGPVTILIDSQQRE
ncbi:MAG: D-aminoacyl-tRNA deacylase [Bacteroidia bacterium]